jgi:hypothetical protein
MDPFFFAMSSRTPVAAAADSASSAEDASSAASRVGTIINVPPVGDNFDSAENFIDNYALDGEGGGDDYTLCQKMVHYCGGGIVPEHWPACKAVLVFHAGDGLSKLSTMAKAVKEAAMMQLYTSAIAELDEIHFGDSARVFFTRSFQRKDEQITGLSLYRYYLDSRAKMRNHLIPLFPKDLVSMKSGKGFHESCNDVFVKAFRDEQSLLKVKRGKEYIPKYTKAEIDALVPPYMWEYSKSPWFLGLCIKIFRRNPHLAPDVAKVMKDVTNVAVSRAAASSTKAAMTRTKQHHHDQAPITNGSNAASLSTPASGWSAVGTSVGPTPSTTAGVVENATTKKLLWAKVLISKSQAENTNIAKRMGKMEELEKAMILLDKMRPVIGEEQYFANVRSVLAAFPVFATFDAKVDVIDLSTDDDDNAPVLSTTAATDSFSTPQAVAPVKNASTKSKNDEDDDVSVEEPSHEHVTTHALLAVLDRSALEGESDYTDDEWAAYLKIQKEKERRLREDDDADAAQEQTNEH